MIGFFRVGNQRELRERTPRSDIQWVDFEISIFPCLGAWWCHFSFLRTILSVAIFSLVRMFTYSCTYGPRVHSVSKKVCWPKVTGESGQLGIKGICVPGGEGNCVRNESGISGRSTTRLAVVYDETVDTEKTTCFLYTYLVNCLLRYTVITALP